MKGFFFFLALPSAPSGPPGGPPLSSPQDLLPLGSADLAFPSTALFQCFPRFLQRDLKSLLRRQSESLLIADQG